MENEKMEKKKFFLYWLVPEVAIIPLTHVSGLGTHPRPPLHARKAVKRTAVYQPQVCTLGVGTEVSGVQSAISATPGVKVVRSLLLCLH